jgi:hypothetical protein
MNVCKKCFKIPRGNQKPIDKRHSTTMAKRKKDKGINTSLQNTTKNKYRSSNTNPTKYWVHVWHQSCYSCYKPGDKQNGIH